MATGSAASADRQSATTAASTTTIHQRGLLAMSSLSESETPLARILHRIMHEIEERIDVDADRVAEIVEMWENLKKKYGIGNSETQGG